MRAQERRIGLEVGVWDLISGASVRPLGLSFAQRLQVYWPLVPPEELRPWKVIES